MIHDHNDKRLGGPNADVMERIEKMNRPKLVQEHPLCPFCSKRHPTETFEFEGMKGRTCPEVPEDRIVSVGTVKFDTHNVFRSRHPGNLVEFPPKHVYEPVRSEVISEPDAAIKVTRFNLTDAERESLSLDKPIPEYGEKRKFL